MVASARRVVTTARPWSAVTRRRTSSRSATASAALGGGHTLDEVVGAQSPLPALAFGAPGPRCERDRAAVGLEIGRDARVTGQLLELEHVEEVGDRLRRRVGAE